MAILTKENLMNVLGDIRKSIENNDSFEGNISYTRMTPGLKRDEFDVQGMFRVGNSQGQGGSFQFEPTSINDQGVIIGREDIAAEQP